MEKNIKLIVSDTDGTLFFPDESVASAEVVSSINDALRRGIIFAVASGRSYESLKNIFKMTPKIIISALDGAYVAFGDEVLYKKPIDESDLKNILSKVTKADYVLYTKNFAYASSENVYKEIFKTENGCVKHISEFSDEEVFKIAFFGKERCFDYAIHYIETNRLLRMCYKSDLITEYVPCNVDKGKTVLGLQKMYNIKYEETAVFGDGKNDIELLKCGYYSYAVGDARPEIKTLAKYKISDAVTEINKF